LKQTVILVEVDVLIKYISGAERVVT